MLKSTIAAAWLFGAVAALTAAAGFASPTSEVEKYLSGVAT
jgi:hypothetical protein